MIAQLWRKEKTHSEISAYEQIRTSADLGVKHDADNCNSHTLCETQFPNNSYDKEMTPSHAFYTTLYSSRLFSVTSFQWNGFDLMGFNVINFQCYDIDPISVHVISWDTRGKSPPQKAHASYILVEYFAMYCFSEMTAQVFMVFCNHYYFVLHFSFSFLCLGVKLKHKRIITAG